MPVAVDQHQRNVAVVAVGVADQPAAQAGKLSEQPGSPAYWAADTGVWRGDLKPLRTTSPGWRLVELRQGRYF